MKMSVCIDDVLTDFFTTLQPLNRESVVNKVINKLPHSSLTNRPGTEWSSIEESTEDEDESNAQSSDI